MITTTMRFLWQRTSSQLEIEHHMAAGLLQAYRYFRSHRQGSPVAYTSDLHRNAPKIGRNEPCPCGSGKKFKRCCGGATVN
jgi:uncharacterized protein